MHESREDHFPIPLRNDETFRKWTDIVQCLYLDLSWPDTRVQGKKKKLIRFWVIFKITSVDTSLSWQIARLGRLENSLKDSLNEQTIQ
ncbi:hypothetical protein NQ315_005502 [Exocentrus adspersus]|uniref:Uncharacterized protein n=1 Tax=Exocentrus adspersus TaxID=1586481 RepID=A0AAV8VTL3_9CUCU|nr:hypothetical protein NQ315_005502 [Exocentrus adspersus]